MPSHAHEALLVMTRADPTLPDWIQTQLGDPVAPCHHARLSDPTVRPHMFQADTVVVLSDEADDPTRATVVEVQGAAEPGKLATWKLYCAQAEAELTKSVRRKKPVTVRSTLVVFFSHPAVAAWYRAEIAQDTSAVRLHPRFVTPADIDLIVDAAVAATNPMRVLFSAFCHRGKDTVAAMFGALLAALAGLERDQKLFYDDVIAGGFSPATRTRWEMFLMTTATGQRYHTEIYNTIDREAQARGEARGEARGKAQSVLDLLGDRGMAVPDSIRQTILACADLDQIRRWQRRALTAVTVQDVISGE
ncbi:hypothetical protein I6A84_03360 [Frankia sp. CNm7]|uniref:Uncharacterized protein n=1 Tax=Frankia nepalensis TaxID=1836974 RepID=A0A937RHL5_9ACTN|nr:hypothetical protein [Frankia nepalensis]MBL7498607.1 hypothetical protein [Frankia nepalensis]MBL7510477.1 hypothetical protein [Frankia nepalensis]MBL7517184.1 hypothetical protein [Frankia nepalensis]MBL7630515.1 hypothetical protein [Frankia nepalensis]